MLLQIQQDQRAFQLEVRQQLATLNGERENGCETQASGNDTPAHDMQHTVAIETLNKKPVYFMTAPQVPFFRGTEDQKHPMAFLEDLELYIRNLEIPPRKQLDTVYEALTGDARDWCNLYKSSWSSFTQFRHDFINTFWSEDAQNKLRQGLATHRWIPNRRRTMQAHFNHYVGLAQRLTTQIPETTLLSELMKHFPGHIQALWALKNDTERTMVHCSEFLRIQGGIMSQFEEKGQCSGNTVPPPKRYRVDNRQTQRDNSGNGLDVTGNAQRRV